MADQNGFQAPPGTQLADSNNQNQNSGQASSGFVPPTGTSLVDPTASPNVIASGGAGGTDTATTQAMGANPDTVGGVMDTGKDIWGAAKRFVQNIPGVTQNPIDTAKGIWHALPPVQLADQTKKTLPVINTYEKSRASGASISDSIKAADITARAQDSTTQALLAAADAYKKNPSRETVRALGDVVALAGSYFLPGAVMEAIPAATLDEEGTVIGTAGDAGADTGAATSPPTETTPAADAKAASVAENTAKAGIAPGTPETVAPTGEDIQPNLQQSIRDHANATSKAAGLEPVPDNVSVMDAEQSVADQATARSKATFAKVEKATGINPTTFKNRISSLNDQIDSLAITDPERAGVLEQQKIGFEETVNKAMTDAKATDPSIDADQARADWNTSLRGDELSKAVRSSKSSVHTQAVPDIDPSKLTPKLQALNESQVSGATAKLQQLPGGADNANSLVESAENARDAAQQIKNFVPKSATGQRALSKIIADNTTAESGLTLRGVKTVAPTDWNGVVKDLGNMPADEARAAFGNDLAQVKQFAAKQAVKQNALDFLKLKTTGGKVTAGVGGTILEEAIRRH